MNVCIRAISFHRDELEVAAKEASVLVQEGRSHVSHLPLTSRHQSEALTSLDNGNPYPKPAIGALKSFCAVASMSGESDMVVYMYVQICGIADLGIPPPSSDILIVKSSLPSTTTTLMGGNESSFSTPWRSTTARSEFFKSSKQMWELGAHCRALIQHED